MMDLQDNTLICHRPGRQIVLERIDPASALIRLGARPALAQAIAHGALATLTEAKALARQAGLITVETGAARERGLLR